MSKLLKYHISILAPFVLLYPAMKYKNTTFIVWFFIFYLIYRGYVDGKRLVDKGILKKSEYWKAFIPLYKAQYFRELYFEE